MSDLHINTDLGQLFGMYDAATHHLLNPKLEVPPVHIDFMNFPTEIRANIVDHYLRYEANNNGTICKAIHYDRFNRKCCVWSWPEELVLCDKGHEDDLPHKVFPKWLPNLALTNHEMRGEVVVHMLNTTSQYTLKYDYNLPIKIAPWFGEFLTSFPGKTGTEGLEAVKDLNFPHIHWYDHSIDGTAEDTNPEVDLMLKCPKLQRVRLTFHANKMHKVDTDGHREPISLAAFLDRFKVEPIIGCNNLEHVYLGGIQWYNGELQWDDAEAEDFADQLEPLKAFGKWLRESFANKKPEGQKIRVTLHRRVGVFCGWGEGEEL